MKTLLRAAALAIGVVAAAAQIAFAQPAPGPAAPADALFQATTLNLSAYGEVKARPDMASIMLGVQTDAPTAAEALAQNATQMSRVMAALKRAGIPDRDLQTAQLSVNPQYVYEPNKPPRLTGYQASNQLTVTTHDLTRLGQTVDAAVGAGATNVGAINFGLNDPTAAEDAARLAAVKALQAKAGLYARALGHPIVRLVSLGEGTGYSVRPPQPLVMTAAKRFDAAETQVSPGEMQVRIEITGLYELAR